MPRACMQTEPEKVHWPAKRRGAPVLALLGGRAELAKLLLPRRLLLLDLRWAVRGATWLLTLQSATHCTDMQQHAAAQRGQPATQLTHRPPPTSATAGAYCSSASSASLHRTGVSMLEGSCFR